MLIRFNVRNFLSFNENKLGNSEEFSMIPGKVRNNTSHIFSDGNVKLLKFASIFGPNNYGKSNLVKAISFMKHTLLFGLSPNCIDMFCKKNTSNRDKVSYFNIEIELNGKYYSYGFEALLNKRKITSEWLIELKIDNKEKIIFTRNIEKGNYELGRLLQKSRVSNRINIYIDDIKNDSSVLFLNLINDHKDNIYSLDSSVSFIKEIYNYLIKDIVIVDRDKDISPYTSLSSLSRIEKLCNLLHSFGCGIYSYKLEETNMENILSILPSNIREELQVAIYDFLEENELFGRGIRILDDLYFFEKTNSNIIKCYRILFTEDNCEYTFSLKEESKGTRKLISLIDILLNDKDKIYIVDNIDETLHPNLTYKWIESFLKLVEKINAQLIVTSHESRLLDFDLLRRDEIWFINKNKDGNSNIYSLEEFNERLDKKIDKAYIEGRYDGVPLFSSLEI